MAIRHDVFVSHAHDDKADVAAPLASLLLAAGLRVWIDDAEISVGDSLNERINQGLAGTRFGVVILSPAFLSPSRSWTRNEVAALLARESGRTKRVLPVLHGLSVDELKTTLPVLADRKCLTTAAGLETVAAALIERVTHRDRRAEAQRRLQEKVRLDKARAALASKRTLTSREVSDLTGVSAARLRSWTDRSVIGRKEPNGRMAYTVDDVVLAAALNNFMVHNGSVPGVVVGRMYYAMKKRPDVPFVFILEGGEHALTLSRDLVAGYMTGGVACQVYDPEPVLLALA